MVVLGFAKQCLYNVKAFAPHPTSKEGEGAQEFVKGTTRSADPN